MNANELRALLITGRVVPRVLNTADDTRYAALLARGELPPGTLRYSLAVAVDCNDQVGASVRLWLRLAQPAVPRPLLPAVTPDWSCDLTCWLDPADEEHTRWQATAVGSGEVIVCLLAEPADLLQPVPELHGLRLRLPAAFGRHLTEAYQRGMAFDNGLDWVRLDFARACAEHARAHPEPPCAPES